MSIEITVDRETFRFESSMVAIGRAQDNHVWLPDDKRIDEHHVALRLVNGQWFIQSSEGGSFSIGSGRPVQLGWLNSGDVIHLTENGPDILFVVKQPGPQAALAPTVVQRAMAQPATSRPPRLSESQARLRSKGNAASPKKCRAPQPESPGTVPPRTILIGGLFAALAAGLGAWTAFPRSAQESELPQPQSEPTTKSSRPTDDSNQTTTEPADFLVLVGIGDLSTDNRPHVLGVGWLLNSETVVAPRTLGNALSELVALTATKGMPRQPCVIQGIPIEVAQITAPEECPNVSVLKLKEPAQLTTPASTVWRQVTATDVERMRYQRKSLTYVSYAAFSRSPKMTGSHGFSLVPYDPEKIQVQTEEARLMYENRSHLLTGNDPVPPLERGGLLIDQEHRIVGMTLLDSSVVWTDCLGKLGDSSK